MLKTAASAHRSSFTFDTFLYCGWPPTPRIRYADRVLPPGKREQVIRPAYCRRKPAISATTNVLVAGVGELHMLRVDLQEPRLHRVLHALRVHHGMGGKCSALLLRLIMVHVDALATKQKYLTHVEDGRVRTCSGSWHLPCPLARKL